MTIKFKDAHLAQIFDAYVEIFNDPNGPLWTPEHGQRKGSSTREAFWNGFDGIRLRYSKNTWAHACWAAGRHCAKIQKSQVALERQRLLELESKRTHRKALDKAIKRREKESVS